MKIQMESSRPILLLREMTDTYPLRMMNSQYLPQLSGNQFQMKETQRNPPWDKWT